MSALCLTAAPKTILLAIATCRRLAAVPLGEHHTSKRRVVVYPDYDCDRDALWGAGAASRRVEAPGPNSRLGARKLPGSADANAHRVG
jgi:hypothetical protein